MMSIVYGSFISYPIYYEENYENANEESAIKSILEMAVRRCMDALQQRF